MTQRWRQLLVQWDVQKDIVISFDDNKVDDELFQQLSSEIIKELIPNLKIRNNFWLYYAEWLKSGGFAAESGRTLSQVFQEQECKVESRTESVEGNSPITILSTSSSASSSVGSSASWANETIELNLNNKIHQPEENSTLDAEEDIETERWLRHEAPGGEDIFSSYSIHNSLPDACRNKLVDLIIKREFLTKTCIKHDRFKTLAKTIEEIFPSENATTYFIPHVPKTKYKKAIKASGKLIHHYAYLVRVRGKNRKAKEALDQAKQFSLASDETTTLKNDSSNTSNDEIIKKNSKHEGSLEMLNSFETASISQSIDFEIKKRFALDSYETEETKNLTTPELQRLVLLEQLYYYREKRQKLNEM